jgi:hypothetical protein
VAIRLRHGWGGTSHRDDIFLDDMDAAALTEFRQAWSIGGDAFRQQCLEEMQGKAGENRAGQTRLETAQAKAERIVADELARPGWTLGDLAAAQKSDPRMLARGASREQDRRPPMMSRFGLRWLIWFAVSCTTKSRPRSCRLFP